MAVAVHGGTFFPSQSPWSRPEAHLAVFAHRLRVCEAFGGRDECPAVFEELREELLLTEQCIAELAKHRRNRQVNTLRGALPSAAQEVAATPPPEGRRSSGLTQANNELKDEVALLREQLQVQEASLQKAHFSNAAAAQEKHELVSELLEAHEMLRQAAADREAALRFADDTFEYAQSIADATSHEEVAVAKQLMEQVEMRLRQGEEDFARRLSEVTALPPPEPMYSGPPGGWNSGVAGAGNGRPVVPMLPLGQHFQQQQQQHQAFPSPVVKVGAVEMTVSPRLVHRQSDVQAMEEVISVGEGLKRLTHEGSNLLKLLDDMADSAGTHNLGPIREAIRNQLSSSLRVVGDEMNRLHDITVEATELVEGLDGHLQPLVDSCLEAQRLIERLDAESGNFYSLYEDQPLPRNTVELGFAEMRLRDRGSARSAEASPKLSPVQEVSVPSSAIQTTRGPIVVAEAGVQAREVLRVCYVAVDKKLLAAAAASPSSSPRSPAAGVVSAIITKIASQTELGEPSKSPQGAEAEKNQMNLSSTLFSAATASPTSDAVAASLSPRSPATDVLSAVFCRVSSKQEGSNLTTTPTAATREPEEQNNNTITSRSADFTKKVKKAATFAEEPEVVTPVELELSAATSDLGQNEEDTAKAQARSLLGRCYARTSSGSIDEEQQASPRQVRRKSSRKSVRGQKLRRLTEEVSTLFRMLEEHSDEAIDVKESVRRSLASSYSSMGKLKSLRDEAEELLSVLADEDPEDVAAVLEQHDLQLNSGLRKSLKEVGSAEKELKRASIAAQAVLRRSRSGSQALGKFLSDPATSPPDSARSNKGIKLGAGVGPADGDADEEDEEDEDEEEEGEEEIGVIGQLLAAASNILSLWNTSSEDVGDEEDDEEEDLSQAALENTLEHRRLSTGSNFSFEAGKDGGETRIEPTGASADESERRGSGHLASFGKPGKDEALETESWQLAVQEEVNAVMGTASSVHELTRHVSDLYKQLPKGATEELEVKDLMRQSLSAAQSSMGKLKDIALKADSILDDSEEMVQRNSLERSNFQDELRRSLTEIRDAEWKLRRASLQVATVLKRTSSASRTSATAAVVAAAAVAAATAAASSNDDSSARSGGDLCRMVMENAIDGALGKLISPRSQKSGNATPVKIVVEQHPESAASDPEQDADIWEGALDFRKLRTDPISDERRTKLLTTGGNSSRTHAVSFDSGLAEEMRIKSIISPRPEVLRTASCAGKMQARTSPPVSPTNAGGGELKLDRAKSMKSQFEGAAMKHLLTGLRGTIGPEMSMYNQESISRLHDPNKSEAENKENILALLESSGSGDDALDLPGRVPRSSTETADSPIKRSSLISSASSSRRSSRRSSHRVSFSDLSAEVVGEDEASTVAVPRSSISNSELAAVGFGDAAVCAEDLAEKLKRLGGMEEPEADTEAAAAAAAAAPDREGPAVRKRRSSQEMAKEEALVLLEGPAAAAAAAAKEEEEEELEAGGGSQPGSRRSSLRNSLRNSLRGSQVIDPSALEVAKSASETSEERARSLMEEEAQTLHDGAEAQAAAGEEVHEDGSLRGNVWNSRSSAAFLGRMGSFPSEVDAADLDHHMMSMKSLDDLTEEASGSSELPNHLGLMVSERSGSHPSSYNDPAFTVDASIFGSASTGGGTGTTTTARGSLGTSVRTSLTTTTPAGDVGSLGPRSSVARSSLASSFSRNSSRYSLSGCSDDFDVDEDPRRYSQLSLASSIYDPNRFKERQTCRVSFTQIAEVVDIPAVSPRSGASSDNDEDEQAERGVAKSYRKKSRMFVEQDEEESKEGKSLHLPRRSCQFKASADLEEIHEFMAEASMRSVSTEPRPFADDPLTGLEGYEPARSGRQSRLSSCASTDSDYDGMMLTAAQIIEWLDTDGDGSITISELRKALEYRGRALSRAGSASDIFGTLDNDGDGTLSKKEIRKCLKKYYGKRPYEALDPEARSRAASMASNWASRRASMAALGVEDSDSGVMTPEKILMLLDSDGDGLLTLEELREWLEDMLVGMDGEEEDKDGGMVKATASQVFRSLDLDGDGYLDKDDIAVAFAPMLGIPDAESAVAPATSEPVVDPGCFNTTKLKDDLKRRSSSGASALAAELDEVAEDEQRRSGRLSSQDDEMSSNWSTGLDLEPEDLEAVRAIFGPGGGASRGSYETDPPPQTSRSNDQEERSRLKTFGSLGDESEIGHTQTEDTRRRLQTLASFGDDDEDEVGPTATQADRSRLKSMASFGSFSDEEEDDNDVGNNPSSQDNSSQQTQAPVPSAANSSSIGDKASAEAAMAPSSSTGSDPNRPARSLWIRRRSSGGSSDSSATARAAVAAMQGSPNQ